jgi:uncharacterized protein involved in outer membrane biogenesis
VNNLLIAIAVFVITVLGALIAVPHFIDWNSYRSAFEEEARNVLGREVQVDGDVKLYLLPTPYFRVEKVRIADTSATLSEHFFKTDSLSIKLSVAPLLRGVVEANEIELQRPVLRLALDGNGGWNWQGFAQALSSTGYVPASVALNSVRVVDGAIAFHDAEGVERARIDGVSGELSAPALEGPYRFRGTYTSGGAPREARISTAAPEADGKVPFRVALRHLDTGASYTLDARAVDLMGKARIEGDLVAQLPIGAPPPGGVSRSAARSEQEPDIDRSETPLEAKAAFKADVAGATFSDLTLTFEQGDRPQIVNGSARAVWRNPVAIEMDLSSRWLDLDQLAGTAGGSGSVASVTKLVAWLRDLLPGDGLTRMSVAIDQANLAGEAVGPVRLALARSGGKLEIKDLRAGLPGGGRGEVKGDLSVAGGAPAFKGTLGVRGTSAARFLAWAAGNGLSIDADGPFEVRAAVALDGAQATVHDLTGALAGTLLKGSGRYKWSGRPELVVALDGPKIDARGLLPASLSLPDLFGALTGAAATQEEARRSPPRRAGWQGFQTDLELQLSAGQLVTAARTYRDFATTVVMKGGNLKQLALKLAGDDGYNLQVEGKIDNLAAQPKGTLRGFVAAESADSIAPLAALLGIPAAFRPGESREQALAPLRLASTLTYGARTPRSADWVVDGEGNGAVIKINARFDGGAGGWRSGPADVTASVEASDAAKLAALLSPGATPGARVGSPKPGRILVRASGVPSEGLNTVAAVEAGDVALNYRGRLTLAEAGANADGDLEVRAADGTALAALAGLAPALRVDGVPVSARLRLAVNGDAIGMDKLALQIGSTKLSGRVALTSAGERRRIDASLDTDELSVPLLLSPLVDRRYGAASAAEAVLFGQSSPWPDEPFNAGVLDAFEGQIRLTCRRLILTDGMSVAGVKASFVLQPGRIEAKEIAGTALGGEVKVAVSVEKAPAGADVRGKLELGIALEEIPGPRPPRASGPMTATISFAGRGLTPRAVVSALQGEGSIAFRDARLPRLSPGAVAAAAEAALKAEAGKLAPTLRQALAAGLASGALPTGNATFALEVADGQLRTKSLAIDAGDGRAIGSARLDLKTLKLDAQWRLETKAPESGAAGSAGRPLPPVIVSYRSHLATLAGTEPQVDTTALEQELSARKIEQDMEELERLRRANEADPLRGKTFDPGAPLQRGSPGLPGGPTVPRPGAPG